MKKHGFTLIEILVVIAIIGILSSIILSDLNTAREKAKIAKAQAEIKQVQTAIAILATDTGKWPNGCGIGEPLVGGSNEIALTDSCSGVTEEPPSSGCVCVWSAQEIAAWHGPYMKVPVDPWGNSYMFDSDYYPRQHCATKDPMYPDTVAVPMVVSGGPNGSGNDAYDCDDIYLELK